MEIELGIKNCVTSGFREVLKRFGKNPSRGFFFKPLLNEGEDEVRERSVPVAYDVKPHLFFLSNLKMPIIVDVNMKISPSIPE